MRGHALYMLGRHGDAVGLLSGCIRRGPRVELGQIWLAATLVRLKRSKEARATEVRQRFVRLRPEAVIEAGRPRPSRHPPVFDDCSSFLIGSYTARGYRPVLTLSGLV